MKRGEVWWAELPKPAGRRPVILLSRDESYQVRNLVTIAPVTTRVRNLPVEVSLGRAEGLSRACVANLDTVTTLPKKSLSARVSMLSVEKIRSLDEALCFALGLE